MLSRFSALTRRMSSSIRDADIDPQGVFKYILIKVTAKQEGGEEVAKEIVRGYEECAYHSDINDKVTEELQLLKTKGELANWRSKVLGGGRIKHDPDGKKIQVYGYSQGYGKADHEVTVSILKKTYPEYTITWSDEGY